MTRQKPALADYEEAVASRSQELAFEQRNARIQAYREATHTVANKIANEEALAGRTQELALDSQKTRGQSYPVQTAAERAQGIQDETEVQKEALAHARMRYSALLSQNVPRKSYRHDFSKLHTPASKASLMEFHRDAQVYTELLPSSPPSQPPTVSTSDSSPDFELVPATYDDIPELVQIHIEAYEYDQMTLLLRRLSGRSVEDYKRELIARVRQTWGETGETAWTWVARRKSDGEALGCAVWVINNEVGKEKEMKEAEKDGKQTMQDVLRQLRFGPGDVGIDKKRMAGDANEPSSKDETPAPPRKGLNEYSHEKMLAMHERWVPAQTRYMCTSPPFPFHPSLIS